MTTEHRLEPLFHTLHKLADKKSINIEYRLNGDKYVLTYDYLGPTHPDHFCPRCGRVFGNARDLDVHFFGHFCDYEYKTPEEMDNLPPQNDITIALNKKYGLTS